MNKTKLNWAWLGLLTCAAVHAAEIDAGAILNKYRNEMTPGFYKPEMPAVDASRYQEFRGLDVQGLPDAAAALVMDFSARRVGQRVVLAAVVAELERVLQDQGFAYVLQPLPDDGKQFLPTLKATQVKFGKVRIEQGSPLDAELAQAVLAHGMVSGEPVDRRQLERNSTVLGETAGVATAYRMVPGDGYGVTDLLANLSTTVSRTGSVTLDNTGSESLGRSNLRADLALQNQLGMGDVLRVYGLKSRGSSMLGLDASWLATASGWRLGGSLSRFEYDYSALAQTAQARNSGQASNLGLYAVYPWVRHEFGRHTVGLNLDKSSTLADSLLNGTPARLSDQHLQKFSASVYGIQALPEAYTGSYQLLLQSGHVRQDIAAVAIEDSAGPRQMGHFAKLSGNAALSRHFDLSGRSWLATLSANFQLSNRNLPGAEKISLGGMSQMRAWAASVTGTATKLTYNGLMQTQAQPTTQGFIAGDQIRISGLAAGLNVGDYVSTLVVDGTDAVNYSIVVANTGLSIAPANTVSSLNTVYGAVRYADQAAFKMPRLEFVPIFLGTPAVSLKQEETLNRHEPGMPEPSNWFEDMPLQPTNNAETVVLPQQHAMAESVRTFIKGLIK